MKKSNDKLVFIHVPKTAGYYCLEYLKKNIDNNNLINCNEGYHLHSLPSKEVNAKRITVLRNPFDQLNSYFIYLNREIFKQTRGTPKEIKKVFNIWIKNTFKNKNLIFGVRKVINNSFNKSFLYPQHNKSHLTNFFIIDSCLSFFWYSFLIKNDYVINFYKLEDGLKIICKEYYNKDIISIEEKINSNDQKFYNYDYYYNSESIKIIEDYYQPILDYFEIDFSNQNLVNQDSIIDISSKKEFKNIFK